MIVDFTITNFRSIKTEQLLSLYAENKPKHHANNICYLDSNIGVLRTCGIYGANAAGKSNVILALEALQFLVVQSGDLKDGEKIKSYDPYLLSPTTQTAPTRFEIEFFVAGQRYSYQIEFNRHEILFEKLDHYRASRPANLFTRSSPTDYKNVKFGEHYKGGKKQIGFFANNAYLSKAGNTPDSPQVARTIYNYFRRSIVTMLVDQHIAVANWDMNQKRLDAMNAFLSKADLGISKFEIETQPGVTEDKFADDFPAELKSLLLAESTRKKVFYHNADGNELVGFEMDRESRGTKRLFSFLPFLIDVLDSGDIVLMDEIEGSLHPHIAELIIKLFNDPAVNKNNAQLIFTTHDLSLMRSDKMRKDQIYLTEKTVENGTELDCLESFDSNLKDSSPFAKWYDEGRLGGIPTIGYREIADALKEAL